MTRLKRFLLQALFIAASSTCITLALLTLLDHRLDLPAYLHFDLNVQAFVHSLSFPHLTRLMLAFTWLGSIKIFASALAIAIVYLLRRHGFHDAFLMGSAITGAFVLNESLKLHFHRMRPQVPWSIGDEHTFSFPSGHSLFSVVFYGMLAYCALHRDVSKRRIAGILVPPIIMPFCIGISRVYLGMHYPTDVAAGWFTGAVWLAAVIAIDLNWHRIMHPEDRLPRILQAPSEAQPSSPFA